MDQIRVGVIGCGKIAQVRHLPEYAANPHCRIVGVYDINTKRAEDVAEKYGAKAYESYEGMLADSNIDAVSICAANQAHAQIAIEAMDAGKHVLCEKPMATTLADCEAMVEASQRNQVFLMIGHNQRLTKAHIFAHQKLQEGAIGRVISFRTTFGHSGPETWSMDPGKNVWFFDKTRAVMGAMADLGIHKTDLLHFLLDDTVQEVTAFVGTLDKRDAEGNLISVDDNAICIYRMTGGAVGTMTASWTYYSGEDNSTVLYGSDGVMRIYCDPEYSVIIEKKDGKVERYALEQIQTNDNQTSSGVIDLWIDSLIRKKPSSLSGEQALHAMRAVFAAIQSGETHKTVNVM